MQVLIFEVYLSSVNYSVVYIKMFRGIFNRVMEIEQKFQFQIGSQNIKTMYVKVAISEF